MKIAAAIIIIFMLSGCNIPLRYQKTEHYKAREAAASEKRMREHQLRMDWYAQRAAFVKKSVLISGGDETLKLAQSKLSDEMKDPESVRFKDVRFVKHDGGALICGLFNAKNSYGAYTGYKLFLSDVREVDIHDAGNVSEYYRWSHTLTGKCLAPRIPLGEIENFLQDPSN